MFSNIFLFLVQEAINPKNQESIRNLVPIKGRKIKLLYLIGQLGFGGSERQLYLLLKYLKKEIFDCHVIVFNPSPNLAFNESLKKFGVKVLEIPKACKGIVPRLLFIYRFVKKLKPDVIHSWTFHDNSYAGVVGWLSGVPIRLGSNRNSLKSVGIQNMPALYRLTSLYSVSSIIVNSNSLEKELIVIKYPKKKIFAITNCVETVSSVSKEKLHVPNLSSFGIGNGDNVIGIVGNLRRQKNHLMFVELMAMLLNKFPKIYGLIVGQPISSEPEMKALIEAKIREFGLEDRVILTGFRDDVEALMRSFTVFCLTSHYEGMPNVMLEAMAASCPVVVPKVQGVEQIIDDGVNGFMVAPGYVEGFSRAVEILLRNRKFAEKVGKAGRETVEQHFGCERMAFQMANLYLDALKKRGKYHCV